MKTQNSPNTEETTVKSNPEAKKNGMSPLWQSVLVGGVPGILIGAAGTVGVEAVANTPESETPEEIQEDTTVEIHEAHSVNDDMSFSEAFAAARAEVGPGGAFVWHGQVYGTYRGDDPEWQEMSAEDRAEHSHEILSQVHAGPYTPTENEPEIVPAPTPEDNSEVEPTPAPETDDDNSDVDVHILGVGEVQHPNGEVEEIGVGIVHDHAAIFADADGDNEVDTVLIDINDNAHLDENDAYVDVSGAGITMDDLRDAVEPGMTEVMDDSQDFNDGGDATLYI
jgi:hypothetical protein